MSPIFVRFEKVLLLSKIEVAWSRLWAIYCNAVQFCAVLWAVHRNYESSEPFIFGQVYCVQISLRLVTNKLSSKTICLVCSYFHWLRSTCWGHYTSFLILAGSSPLWWLNIYWWAIGCIIGRLRGRSFCECPRLTSSISRVPLCRCDFGEVGCSLWLAFVNINGDNIILIMLVCELW